MELQTGPAISLGQYQMGDVPTWIEESVLPAAREDRQPLLDIYAEVLRLRQRMDRIEELVIAIHRQVHMAWYRRLWQWAAGLF